MSMSLKERAQRRLRTLRKDGLEYDPRPSPSTSSAFAESPILYYSVYDQHLSPVRKGMVYAHSLEELYYMAIDNAARLDTLDLLFRLRSDFSSRTITIRDLILTAFVGTSDGSLNSMLVCPYQGDTPYSLDTTLYATVMSDLVRNTHATPLRIALNVPTTMQKWSHISKLRLFGASVDSKLIELNNRVNCGQIVELRNDPEGAVRYSKKALEAMRASQNPPKAVQSGQNSVAPASAAILDAQRPSSVGESDLATASMQDSSEQKPLGIAELETETVQDLESPIIISTDEKTLLNGTATDQSDTNLDSHDRVASVLEADQAGSHSDIQGKELSSKTAALDISSITGPLQAAQLTDNTITEMDIGAVSASESHPAFETTGSAEDRSPELFPKDIESPLAASETTHTLVPKLDT